jgi:hypothetical protein
MNDDNYFEFCKTCSHYGYRHQPKCGFVGRWPNDVGACECEGFVAEDREGRKEGGAKE